MIVSWQTYTRSILSIKDAKSLMDKIVRTLKAMHLNLAVIFGSCILNDFYRTDSGMISKPFGLYSGVPIYFSFVSGSALQQQKVRPSLASSSPHSIAGL